MRTLFTKLFADGHRISHSKGSVILHATDTPRDVYYITSGWVKVYKADRHDEEKILMTLGPGDIFPCAWVITDTVHDVSFAALDTTQTLRISATTFMEAVASRPRYAQELLQLFAQQFYALVDYVKLIHFLAQRLVVRQRLVQLLVDGTEFLSQNLP